MPLPSPELIGLTDPREVSGALGRQAPLPGGLRPEPIRASEAGRTTSPVDDVSSSGTPAPLLPYAPPARTPTRSPRGPASDSQRVERSARASATPAFRLAPENRTFVQIMVAAEVRERLAEASFALEDVRPGLHLQQTIVGALIARHVQPDDPAAMDRLLMRLNDWTDNPLSQRRGEALKLGWRLPHSLTRRVDKAVLLLKATHLHLAPSAKALLASLIMSELEPSSSDGLERLVDLVTPYVKQFERPVATAAPVE